MNHWSTAIFTIWMNSKRSRHSGVCSYRILLISSVLIPPFISGLTPEKNSSHHQEMVLFQSVAFSYVRIHYNFNLLPVSLKCLKGFGASVLEHEQILESYMVALLILAIYFVYKHMENIVGATSIASNICSL